MFPLTERNYMRWRTLIFFSFAFRDTRKLLEHLAETRKQFSRHRLMNLLDLCFMRRHVWRSSFQYLSLQLLFQCENPHIFHHRTLAMDHIRL